MKKQNKLELKMYKDWMKNDLERQIKESGEKRKDICKDVGIRVSYLSNCIHRGDDMKVVTPRIRRLYDYFNKKEEVKLEQKKEFKEETKKDIKEAVENENEFDFLKGLLDSCKSKDESMKLCPEILSKIVDILVENSTQLLNASDDNIWMAMPKAEIITRQMELINDLIENNK